MVKTSAEMKKITVCLGVFFALFLLWASVSFGAATKMYGRIALTGGTKSVDNITTMIDGDLCFAVVSKTLYIYVYDDDDVTAEGANIAGIDPIEPDSGSGAWNLITSVNLGASSNPTWIFRDLETVNDISAATVDVQCTDAGDGTEDCDYTIKVMVAGSLTARIKIDADGYVEISGSGIVIPDTSTIGSTSVPAAVSIAADGDVDVVNDFTAGTITSDGAISGTTIGGTIITASTGFALGDTDYVGIAGNEIITFNAAGSINVTGATFDVDGAFTASTVGSDGAVTATTNVVIGDAGNIGSASDTDAIAIASTGVVTLSQKLIPSGGTAALTPIAGTAAGFTAGFTGANLYGGTYRVTTAGTLPLPEATVDMNFTILLEVAGATTIASLTGGTADTIYLNGLAAAQDEDIVGSTIGSMCVFQYQAANTWMALCNGFAEVTPP